MNTIKKSWFLFLILGAFLLNFGGVDTENYAVERPDGGITVVYYVPGSEDSLDDVLRDMSLSGFPISKVKKSDLPPTREFRNTWTKLGKRIVEDGDKKIEIIQEKERKESKKQAVLSKLKISEEELDVIKKA